jgi:hypothetical protein
VRAWSTRQSWMWSTTTAGRAPRSSRLFKGAPAGTPILPGTAGAVGLCAPGLGFLCNQPACITQSVHVALTGSLPGQQERITCNTNADGEAGTADASEVWERFSQGFSLRLLHPQRWRDELWLALAPLEALFNCPIGCNAYLTPGAAQARLSTSCQRLCAACPGRRAAWFPQADASQVLQGFAPHYDDIDAFVLQLEGCKRCIPNCQQQNVPSHSKAWCIGDPRVSAAHHLCARKLCSQNPRVSQFSTFPCYVHRTCLHASRCGLHDPSFEPEVIHAQEIAHTCCAPAITWMPESWQGLRKPHTGRMLRQVAPVCAAQRGDCPAALLQRGL